MYSATPFVTACMRFVSFPALTNYLLTVIHVGAALDIILMLCIYKLFVSTASSEMITLMAVPCSAT